MVGEEQKEISEDDLIINLYRVGQTIASIRNRPLLVMFYSREQIAGIKEEDLYFLEKKLEEKLGKKVKELDVLLQTLGGEADCSYLLAQLIRDYCDYMETLIPNYSYSGGTLICLASNLINLGKTARLSPIDLQLGFTNGEDEEIPSFPLMNIEKYVEFVMDTCKKFQFVDERNKTDYITPLMMELVKEINPTKLGELFRMRGLSEYHSRILLANYMFKNEPNRGEIVEYITNKLTKDTPSHDFEIDYHMARGIGLKVKPMDRKIYKLARDLLTICGNLKRRGIICQHVFSGKSRKPFFEIFFPQKKGDENE